MTTKVQVDAKELARLVALAEERQNAAPTAKDALGDTIKDQATEAARKAGERTVFLGGSDDTAAREAVSRFGGASPASIQLSNMILQGMRSGDTANQIRRSTGKSVPAGEALQRAAFAVSGKRFQAIAPGTGEEFLESCPADEIWKGVECQSGIPGLFGSVRVIGGKAKVITVAGMPEVTAVLPAQQCGDMECSPSSTIPLAKEEWEAGKLKVTLCWPFEMEEDAVVASVDQLTDVALKAMDDAWVHLILRGDSTTIPATDNINHFGAPMVMAAPGHAPYYTMADGIAHSTLIDNPANSLGAPLWIPGSPLLSADPLIALRDLMDDPSVNTHWGYCTNDDDLVFITDYGTYSALLRLEELKFCDRNCANPTLNTGSLPSIWGIRVIPTMMLPKTDINGLVDAATPANNIYGQLHLVNRRGFRLGMARDLTVKTIVDDDCETVKTIITMRPLIVRLSRTGNPATIETVASIYGIQV